MAGVFGNLFESEDGVVGSDDFDNFSRKTCGIEAPPRSRAQCHLSGINNQGATCYLNSLLQTLLYTPEFRDALFYIGENELGCLQDADNPAAKVRVIPIQLQRLFARLLLKNCQSVSSSELTQSFGWTNDEQFQQHDVQELNRILFSAIESSLVGTSGHDLISRLYHGKIVNQIRCKVCGNVSESQEDFLDLPVTVAGSLGLEQTLTASYLDTELLSGRNQYHCSVCNKLVDAEKGARIRSLPSILTLSLLRFSFNFQTLERYKETSKFTFPYSVDMKPFCDQVGDNENLEYELFSVVIHSGGAHGGHYHAYIRDIDSLGHWFTPEEEEILVKNDPSKGSLEFIECDSPVDLVQLLLTREKNKGMGLEKLGQEILAQTGRSWNKAFKSRYGSMTKFVTKYNDKFIYDPANKHVSLKVYGRNNDPAYCDSVCTCIHQGPGTKSEIDGTTEIGSKSHDRSCDLHGDKCGKNASNALLAHGDSKSPLKIKNAGPPARGRAWFDFNDSRVHPIYERELEKQFSGRESAYMLFYRQKTLVRPNTACGDRTYCIPERFINEMVIENELLEAQREAYDRAMNQLTLQIHCGACYQYREGALKPRRGMEDWRELIIDQRKHTADLYNAIRQFGDQFVPYKEFQVNKFRELPAGGHLYDIVPEGDNFQLQHLDIQDGSKLFVWDGMMVEEQVIPMGLETEPLFLTVIYGEGLQFSQGYSKTLTVQEMMVIVCDIIRIQVCNLLLKRLCGKDSELKVIPFMPSELTSTLAELGFKDGDQLLAEDKNGGGDTLSAECITTTLLSSKILIHLENRCGDLDLPDAPTATIEVDKDISVGELKGLVLTRFGLVTEPEEGGRLRIEHETLGLRHPLHEELTVFEAGISQGSKVILEPGPTPKSDEITVLFTCDDKSEDTDYREIMITHHATVDMCLQCILNKANIKEGDWHLRRTNWCGEAAELLDDSEETLEGSCVNDGDLLLLERGRLAPKGYIRLSMWLYSTPASVRTAAKQEGGLMCWMASIYNLLALPTEVSSSSRTEEVTSLPHPVHLGEVEISRETTLEELKQQVMTLNIVSDLPIPGPDFMRLRLVEKKQLTTILRDKDQTLRRLKLTSNSVLGLQIVPEEEALSQNQIVLNICHRIPDTKRYEQGIELVWDVSSSASLYSLRQAVSEVLAIEAEHVVMAKHFPHKYEWVVLEKNDKQGNAKGKKGNAGKNLRQAPFHIRDGDTVGVKDTRFDPNNIDDFMTEDDHKGREQVLKEMDEKRKMREERRKLMEDLGPIQKTKRREVGISIKVGNFS